MIPHPPVGHPLAQATGFTHPVHRHCERSEATQEPALGPWVASPAARNDGLGDAGQYREHRGSFRGIDVLKTIQRLSRQCAKRLRGLVVFCLAATFAIPSPLSARDRTVRCLIAVDGHVFLKGPCNYSPQKDGSFSIGTGDASHASPYFAYVNQNDDGTADASWNEDPRATHAHATLGTVTRHGACWTNAHAKICAED